ncbi:MAG: ubiquinol-cytochrome c reductase iron-sulfur subunit [Planctomycetes bacterium]|nr:ubiquinol-cytochrome c reductase iron-sulfur subunit [Planctomycetota bacterium]
MTNHTQAAGSCEQEASDPSDRRSFLSMLTMALGLSGGYGALALMAARFLYPAKPPARQWMYVAAIGGLEQGGSVLFSAPNGQSISVTRLAEDGVVEDFIALSSICPHLGCKVHWETQNRRFFCPCHNGAFDAAGEAVSGPPADSHQNLARFPLKVENGNLFIEVPLA